jgi:TetR/AcrR family fatty acid metabolism transcriptional regulator
MAGRGPDKEARRQAILLAARQVFARKGYDPATLEAVAREAGLAKGTLYLYFRDKEDLFFQVVLATLESLQDSIREQAQRQEGALPKLRAVAAGQFSFFLHNRDTLHLFVPVSNPGLARLHRRLIGPMMEKWNAHVQRVTALVEEGQHTGAVRQDLEARHIALAFIGMTSQASQSFMRMGPLPKSALVKDGAPAVPKGSTPSAPEAPESPERMADMIMRILVEGVMRR